MRTKKGCSMVHGASIRILTASLLLGAATGCASRSAGPTLYPDEHYRSVGEARVEADMAECQGLADQYVQDSDRYNSIARQSATGAVIGTASGALAGVIAHANVGRSLGAGAAVGAIIPLLQKLFTADASNPTRANFVGICLREKGYQVVGN